MAKIERFLDFIKPYNSYDSPLRLFHRPNTDRFPYPFRILQQASKIPALSYCWFSVSRHSK